MLGRDVPSSASAYEFYLRGNQLIQQVGLGSSERFALARDLYLRCLEDDPRYAPAWARLGRCYQLLSKAGENPEENVAKAESTLKRALELNPTLALGHKLYAQVETDMGHAADAVIRLLRHSHPETADPDLFAGLVHACRYCGLLEASAAAHERARRLDPKIPTGIRHTYWLLGDYERAVEQGVTPPFYLEALPLASMRREAEALSTLRERALEQQRKPSASSSARCRLSSRAGRRRAWRRPKRPSSTFTTRRRSTTSRGSSRAWGLAGEQWRR